MHRTALGKELFQQCCKKHEGVNIVSDFLLKVDGDSDFLLKVGGDSARSRITTNLKQEVRDYVYTFMYPEEYTLTKTHF